MNHGAPGGERPKISISIYSTWRCDCGSHKQHFVRKFNNIVIVSASSPDLRQPRPKVSESRAYHRYRPKDPAIPAHLSYKIERLQALFAMWLTASLLLCYSLIVSTKGSGHDRAFSEELQALIRGPSGAQPCRHVIVRFF
jgi:hypothetical protein